MKKLLLLAIVAAAAIYLGRQPDQVSPVTAEPTAAQAPAGTGGNGLANAYAERKSGVQVAGEGTVSRILGDDSMGDWHQRFILTLDSGRTLLIAHNIDIAPRIESLQEGDTVSFSGEYEWNDKGGIVHWTHHDPQGQHAAGWIRHRGRVYQ